MYRRYTQEQLSDALTAVRSGTLGLRAAARAFGVPAQTIGDRIAGRIPDLATSGPDPILTIAEEKLCTYICMMCDIGYPMSKKELLQEVKRLMDLDGRRTPFTNNLPGIQPIATTCVACSCYSSSCCFLFIHFRLCLCWTVSSSCEIYIRIILIKSIVSWFKLKFS
jgi:hypothetical protein